MDNLNILKIYIGIFIYTVVIFYLSNIINSKEDKIIDDKITDNTLGNFQIKIDELRIKLNEITFILNNNGMFKSNIDIYESINKIIYEINILQKLKLT